MTKRPADSSTALASPPLASPPLASPPLASPPLASPPLASPPLASPPLAREWPALLGLASVLFSMAVAFACAPSMSSLESAQVVGKYSTRIHGGYEAEISTGAVSNMIDAGKTLANAADSRRLSDAEKLQLLDAGVALMVLPPSFTPVIGGTFGLTDDWEVQLRYAGEGLRLGSRYQLLRHETGPFDMVAGLGVSRAITEIPVADWIKVIKVDDFTRTSFDVPLLIGTSRNYFRAWGGPVFMYTRATTALRLELPDEVPIASRFVANGVFLGGQSGIAFGWKRLFIAFELTVARFMGTAHTSVNSLAGGANHDVVMRSTVFQPTVGILGEI